MAGGEAPSEGHAPALNVVAPAAADGTSRLELPEAGALQVPTVSDFRDVSEVGSQPVSRNHSTRSGMVLIARDLKDPSADDASENHLRSQMLLREILVHRGLQTNTMATFVEAYAGEAETREQQRLAFARRVFGRLRERGIHGIRNFRRLLHSMDMESDGTCHGRTLEGALAHLGVRLKADEFTRLLQLFAAGGDEEDDPEGRVDYVMLLAHGCSNWTALREEVVQEAFDVLSENCPGSLLSTNAIETRFRSQALTSAHVPELLEHDSVKEFLTQWNSSFLGADGIVTWLDFADYYLDVSMCIDSEQEFCQYVCRSWGIDMDDWLAKKVFRRFADTDNENILPEQDFFRMLDELDPSITKEEAAAWYEAIDEDDSGEVSLEEFLSSKVLKVKRLFDEFDPHHERKVTREVLIKILQSLNNAISDEEAAQLYQYADLDNNGDISFAEFLKNNLLKLLQIFDEFDRDKGRSFNEAEMKMLLRKMDPYLDDYDIHQCYKAIDTDGGGSISFVEFCESHVLRAKMLFDRYDTDRSRALTQFKFRELILDMDSTLTQAQMEAIYNLVADQNTGKVHLGGFLNPNLVKLKLLFDKYDQDRSRYLDASEFKELLKDLFKSATEKDVEELIHSVFPEDEDQGVTFTMYIQRFKEISRRHDIIQLAKKREARTKAKSKGLMFK